MNRIKERTWLLLDVVLNQRGHWLRKLISKVVGSNLRLCKQFFISGLQKSNKVPSVRDIVISSDHRLLWLDSDKDVDLALTLPESILHQIIILIFPVNEIKEAANFPIWFCYHHTTFGCPKILPAENVFTSTFIQQGKSFSLSYFLIKNSWHNKKYFLKIKAIENIGYGQLAKIFLSWKNPWWAKGEGGIQLAWTSDVTSLVRPNPNDLPFDSKHKRSWYRGICNFSEVDFHPNLLVCWIAGDSAATVDLLEDDEVSS